MKLSEKDITFANLAKLGLLSFACYLVVDMLFAKLSLQNLLVLAVIVTVLGFLDKIHKTLSVTDQTLADHDVQGSDESDPGNARTHPLQIFTIGVLIVVVLGILYMASGFFEQVNIKDIF